MAEAGREYLKDNSVQDAISDAVAQILRDRPINPIKALGEILTAKGSTPFGFTSGLLDCCSSNPEAYKVIAEVPGARLVEMTLPAGGQDQPHDHPQHSMFFVTSAKLSITNYDGFGMSKNDAHDVEVPAGAAPIFPPGAHQVKNVGDKEVKVMFVEAYPTCEPCGPIPDYISPFTVSPECYSILAENDDWITGMLTMEVGQKDGFHYHKDHLIFVLEGDGVTINPGGDESAKMVVPLKVGAGIPAPMAAPPFFSHTLVNSGTTKLKMLFFEKKK